MAVMNAVIAVVIVVIRAVREAIKVGVILVTPAAAVKYILDSLNLDGARETGDVKVNLDGVPDAGGSFIMSSTSFCFIDPLGNLECKSISWDSL